VARTFETIRDKIVTQLNTLDDIAEVNSAPIDIPSMKKFPNVCVYPLGQISDYQNTQQNERTYNFAVTVFYEVRKKTPSGALTALYDLVDQILDLFDKDPTLTGISLPAGKQMIDIVPATSEWGEDLDSQTLMTTITLGVRVSSDIC